MTKGTSFSVRMAGNADEIQFWYLPDTSVKLHQSTRFRIS